MHRSHTSHGFTLVELLVVITIIALLTAILLPALQQARAVAQMVNCQSRQRQVGIGMLLYAEDYDNYLPHRGGWNYQPNWAERIADYIDYQPRNAADGLLYCPGETIDGVWRDFSPGQARGFVMNNFVAQSKGSFEQLRLDHPWTDNRQMVIYDAWQYNVLPERVQMKAFDVAFRSCADVGNPVAHMAYRHTGALNFLRKDGGVAATGPGDSGYGAEIVWGYNGNDNLFHDGY